MQNMLNKIIKAISDAKCTGDLYPVLDALSNETERIVDTRSLNAEQACLIAQYLTEIRLLLTTMAGAEVVPAGAAGRTDAKKLAALYGEIEGRMKELRNDLAGKRNGKREQMPAPGL